MLCKINFQKNNNGDISGCWTRVKSTLQADGHFQLREATRLLPGSLFLPLPKGQDPCSPCSPGRGGRQGLRGSGRDQAGQERPPQTPRAGHESPPRRATVSQQPPLPPACPRPPDPAPHRPNANPPLEAQAEQRRPSAAHLAPSPPLYVDPRRGARAPGTGATPQEGVNHACRHFAFLGGLRWDPGARPPRALGLHRSSKASGARRAHWRGIHGSAPTSGFYFTLVLSRYITSR